MCNKLPLVSILIPTYNQTKYLKRALDSAINQTYENTEIIICDDSTVEDVKLLITEYMKKNNKIKYYNNGGPLGGYGLNNSCKCFNLAKGEYINFLYHDDAFYPTKIEKMVDKLTKDKSLTLITSSRTFINENDIEIGSFQSPYGNDIKLNGNDVARRILFTIDNYIGEPTTVMFRKKDIIDDGIEIFSYYNSNIKCLVDIALFLRLCAKGDVFYIKEPLSKFRRHPEQNSFDSSLMKWTAIDFFNIVIDSYERNIFIENTEELFTLLNNWRIVYTGWLGVISREINESSLLEKDLCIFKKRLKEYGMEIGIID